MKQVTVHTAKSQLSKLIDAALAGEDIIIAKGKRPVVRLVAIPQGRFEIGALKEVLHDSCPDFLEPADDDELTLWEGGS